MVPHDIDMVEAANELRHHAPPDERTADAHELARSTIFASLALLASFVPAGRDKSLMKTHLEDALMRANRAIAINEGPLPSADIQALAESLNRVLGDWVHLGWHPDYPVSDDEDEAPEGVRASRRTNDRRAHHELLRLEQWFTNHPDFVKEGSVVNNALRLLGEAYATQPTAERAARAFHSLLVEGHAPGTMVPTAINHPWDEVEGAWRNTLVAVFSELYGQGTIR